MRKKVGSTEVAIVEMPTPESEEHSELKSWALVELFGHQKIVGYLSEQKFGNGVMFRVDVPDLLKDAKVVRKGFTRYFGLSAIYSVTPIDEEMVRRLLPSIDGTPAARPLTIPSYGERDEWG